MPPKPRATKRKRASTAVSTGQHASMPHSVLIGLAGLQHTVASLDNRISSLMRRFITSQGGVCAEASVLTGPLTIAGKEAAFDCAVLTSHVAKALEAAAEEARVAAAQLEAYAVLLEREAEEDEEETGVAATSRALLSSPADTAPHFAVVTWSRDIMWHVIDDAVRVRDGIDRLRCVVSGSGRSVYQAGDNHMSVRAADGEGEVVESIEAEDVCVSVSVKGASVTHTAVEEAGVVSVMYRVPADSVGPITLSVSVCGAALFPWTVTFVLRGTVLASVAPQRLAAVLRVLTTEWLPSRAYTLLYRGSRDGMTPSAFHGLCDGKGPTLVLIRCHKGFVFGGYTGASWEPLPRPCVASPDAFVFSVVGPHSPGPVKFPAMVVGQVPMPQFSDANRGPVFQGGFTVKGSGGLLTPASNSPFDQTCSSCCDIGRGAFEDVLEQGPRSLTGAYNFLPVEIEVYAVAPLASTASA